MNLFDRVKDFLSENISKTMFGTLGGIMGLLYFSPDMVTSICATLLLVSYNIKEGMKYL